MRLTAAHLLEVLVTVDVLLVMRVLQLVGLHILPEGLDDAGAGLGVNAKQPSQAGVQLKLGRLWRQCNHVKTPPQQSLYFSFPTPYIPITFKGCKQSEMRWNVSIRQRLSALRGLQVVNTAADFTAPVSHTFLTDETIYALSWEMACCPPPTW